MATIGWLLSASLSAVNIDHQPSMMIQRFKNKNTVKKNSGSKHFSISSGEKIFWYGHRFYPLQPRLWSSHLLLLSDQEWRLKIPLNLKIKCNTKIWKRESRKRLKKKEWKKTTLRTWTGVCISNSNNRVMYSNSSVFECINGLT